MSLPLSAEDEARYTSIIDAILATADLNTVTRKKVRMGLERALGGKDLGEQKTAIKKLIEARFDAVSGNNQNSPTTELPPSSMPHGDPSPKRHLNGHSEYASGENDEDELDAGEQPAKKKQRRERPAEDADAKLAAQLQAQENQRGRTTRGSSGGSNRVVKKKKAPRKKSDKKVKGEDDSDIDSSEAAPKRKPGGGFQKPLNLSFALAEVCGDTQMSRTQVVKKLWEHIKANDLQDPKDKRQIICDDKMYAVFKQAKIDMFQMNKFIGNHLYPVDEE